MAQDKIVVTNENFDEMLGKFVTTYDEEKQEEYIKAFEEYGLPWRVLRFMIYN